MDRDQSLELLNATHDFPCAYMVKVIGVATDEFVARVFAVCAEAAVGPEMPYQLRHTPSGRHVAITLEPTLESAEQVLGLYDRVRSLDGVVLTM